MIVTVTVEPCGEVSQFVSVHFKNEIQVQCKSRGYVYVQKSEF